ncbi:MAG: hypothetical protein MJY66_03285 [Bacteroidaceae bacterium]|nr:hypothetical protein [Bacteroidaceae bacterium]
MKKRDLLFASALLLGFGLNASAQDRPESEMFFFGFEDGLTSFEDSSKPAQVIDHIDYFADDPTSSGDWTIVYTKDSVMNLLNGYSPANRSGEKDVVSIVEDAEGAHELEFTEMGAEGGNKWLKWQTAGAAGGSDCNDYEANLFIRGLDIQDETSYRLVFYLKSAAATGTVQAGIFRGQYNSEKPISRDGASGNEFLLELKEFKEDTWERHTLMTYYQNDSVATNHMYKAGYWWNDSWKVTVTDPESGEEKTYNKIDQFDTYFVRFAFRSPGSTFYVDDIALYKSWIGGAECNADIIRVDFGYQTNLADLAKASPDGAIELPGEYFSVIGIDEEQSPEPMEIKVLSAEYHADGYLYMWLDDECSYYKDIKVNFTNPVDDPKLALKYTGSLYPKALDKEWVDAGKLVPDFQDEFVLPNPDVFATSLEFLAPSVASTDPENGSFNLDPATKDINVTFSKEVFVDIAAGINTTGVLAQLQSAAGKEYWTPSAYDADTYTVTFTRQGSGDLKGDYDFTIMNMRAGEEDSYEAADPVTISLSFGAITGGEPISYYNSDESWADAATHPEQCIPMHWASTAASSTDFSFGDGTAKSGCSRMYWYAAGSDIKYGMYISPRGGSTDSRFAYGMEDGTPLRLTAGDYWLSFKIIGWDNVYSTNVYFYALGAEETGDPIGTVKPENSVPSGSANNKSYVCTGMTSCRYNITVPEDGDYVIEFRLPKGAGWTGSLIGGIELTNQYSSAYKYIKMINDAYSDANALLAKSKEDAKYSGQYQDEFAGIIAKYDGFSSTSPSAYEAATKALKDATTAMNTRISNVDNYYKSYAAGQSKIEATDSAYGKTAANEALKGLIAQYENLDVTVIDNDSVNNLKKQFDDAVAAIDTRIKNADAYNKECEDNLSTIQAEGAYKQFKEYSAMVSTYEANNAVDVIAATDDEITAATDAMKAARTAYNFQVAAVGAKTMQIKALAELAEAYDVDFGSAAADVAARLASATEDDQELAEIYKQAIKAKIYSLIAAGELDPAGENIELYPFITNYALYNVMAKEDMEYYFYSYSSVWRYRLKTNITFTDNVFPGWTVSGVFGSAHVGNEGRNWDTEAPVFDAGLSCDWTSGAVISGTISGLPVGVYSLGANVQHGVDNCTFQVTVPEGMDSTMTMAKSTGVLTMDEVLLPAGEASIKYSIGSGNGWDYIYDFTAIMTGIDDNFQYEAAATEAQAALNELITIVPATKQNSDAKFYNLNGVEVKNPAGIAIKVTDGKAQKVLVK